jgi:3-hydroxyacyl-CoA dehydrogenase/enoyl-CoA hydratase/carnithine racemase
MMTSNFTVTRKTNIAVVTLDMVGSKLNVLSTAIVAKFETLLDQIAHDDTVKAVVLISGKPDNFIAGADIEEFLAFRNARDALTLSQKAQALMNRIEASLKPIVCAINGACLGGGLETALACHYRIATDNVRTQLGLPEVTLGILPAAGGTQRMPPLVGVKSALALMLTGKRVGAQEAHDLGFVDQVASTDGLLDIALSAAEQLISGTIKRRTKSGLAPLATARDWLILRKARSDVERKTKGHYPAPIAIIDTLEHSLRNGMTAGLEFEAEKFGELTQTPQCKNLIRLFFLQTAHKKNADFPTQLKASRIGVVGAGFMGSGVALVSIKSKYDVSLADVDAEALGRAEKRIRKEVQDDKLLSKLSMSTKLESLKQCDVVIEAVFEDISVKQKLLAEIEPYLSDTCVFASNTSALPISEIAKHSKRKDRIVGMHYFSPVHKMPLLEVIQTKESSCDAVGLAINVGLRQGKTVIVVQDSPGFYTSRILTPYLDEAISLALEGIDLREIDLYMENFGFPVGPITLLDEVGIDVAAHATTELIAHLGTRLATANQHAMDRMLKEKLLGRKTKMGFYLYEDTPAPIKALKNAVNIPKPINPKMRAILNDHYKQPVLRSITAQDIQMRMVLRMVNEAVLCLQEKIVRSEEDADLGAVLGLGFPAYLGGPFQYIKAEGPAKIVANLRRFADHFGAHFEPAPLLVEMAKKVW